MTLPAYLSEAKPNPASNRAPWWQNTAPTYAGIFLWIAFYQSMAEGTVDRAPWYVLVGALALAGILSYALYYFVPAMLGMRTGYPLYVVGSSTFGATGGYLMPGLLMGLLQVGWFAVGAFFATKYILAAAGSSAGVGSVPFAAIAIAWGLVMGLIGVLGIQYVARVSLLLNAIPLIMLLLVFSQTNSGIAAYGTPSSDSLGASLTILQLVIGFFATAGAAGADFGMGMRNEDDVRKGGLVGIAAAITFTGTLALLGVIGAKGLNPSLASFQFDAVIGSIGGFLATAMFALFALASIGPACFCAFIAGNSFSTMIPSVPRMVSTMTGVAIAVALAVTGVAENLAGFFGIVGASFGPICGAMAADWFLSGKKWAGPREGINWAGYGAWAIGFLVGIGPTLGWNIRPAALWSFVAGFVVYVALAKAGLVPRAVPLRTSAAASA
jgi:cytosine permease